MKQSKRYDSVKEEFLKKQPASALYQAIFRLVTPIYLSAYHVNNKRVQEHHPSRMPTDLNTVFINTLFLFDLEKVPPNQTIGESFVLYLNLRLKWQPAEKTKQIGWARGGVSEDRTDFIDRVVDRKTGNPSTIVADREEEQIQRAILQKAIEDMPNKVDSRILSAKLMGETSDTIGLNEGVTSERISQRLRRASSYVAKEYLTANNDTQKDPIRGPKEEEAPVLLSPSGTIGPSDNLEEGRQERVNHLFREAEARSRRNSQ